MDFFNVSHVQTIRKEGGIILLEDSVDPFSINFFPHICVVIWNTLPEHLLSDVLLM